VLNDRCHFGGLSHLTAPSKPRQRPYSDFSFGVKACCLGIKPATQTNLRDNAYYQLTRPGIQSKQTTMSPNHSITSTSLHYLPHIILLVSNLLIRMPLLNMLLSLKRSISQALRKHTPRISLTSEHTVTRHRKFRIIRFTDTTSINPEIFRSIFSSLLSAKPHFAIPEFVLSGILDDIFEEDFIIPLFVR